MKTFETSAYSVLFFSAPYSGETGTTFLVADFLSAGSSLPGLYAVASLKHQRIWVVDYENRHFVCKFIATLLCDQRTILHRIFFQSTDMETIAHGYDLMADGVGRLSSAHHSASTGGAGALAFLPDLEHQLEKSNVSSGVRRSRCRFHDHTHCKRRKGKRHRNQGPLRRIKPMRFGQQRPFPR